MTAEERISAVEREILECGELLRAPRPMTAGARRPHVDHYLKAPPKLAWEVAEEQAALVTLALLEEEDHEDHEDQDHGNKSTSGNDDLADKDDQDNGNDQHHDHHHDQQLELDREARLKERRDRERALAEAQAQAELDRARLDRQLEEHERARAARLRLREEEEQARLRERREKDRALAEAQAESLRRLEREAQAELERVRGLELAEAERRRAERAEEEERARAMAAKLEAVARARERAVAEAAEREAREAREAAEAAKRAAEERARATLEHLAREKERVEREERESRERERERVREEAREAAQRHAAMEKEALAKAKAERARLLEEAQAAKSVERERRERETEVARKLKEAEESRKREAEEAAAKEKAQREAAERARLESERAEKAKREKEQAERERERAEAQRRQAEEEELKKRQGQNHRRDVQRFADAFGAHMTISRSNNGAGAGAGTGAGAFKKATPTPSPPPPPSTAPFAPLPLLSAALLADALARDRAKVAAVGGAAFQAQIKAQRAEEAKGVPEQPFAELVSVPPEAVALDEAALTLAFPATPLEEVVEVNLALENIGWVSDLWRCPSLRHLSLNSNLLTSISGLDRNGQLQSLKLRDNRIARISGLERLERLTELVLDQNQISTLEGLSGCPRLQVLSVTGNKLSRIGGLEAQGQLKKLLLYRNQISRVENLAHLECLTYLDLGRNRLREVGDGLRGCRLLESLVLYENAIERFPDLTGCVSLKRLWLNGNRIEALPAVTGLMRLEYLNLQDNRIAEVAPGALVACSALHTLNLSFNALTDIRFFELGALPRLRVLAINDNPVTIVAPPEPGEQLEDPSWQALAHAPWITELNNVPVEHAHAKAQVAKRAADPRILHAALASGLLDTCAKLRPGAAQAALEPAALLPRLLKAGPEAQAHLWKVGAHRLAVSSSSSGGGGGGGGVGGGGGAVSEDGTAAAAQAEMLIRLDATVDSHKAVVDGLAEIRRRARAAIEAKSARVLQRVGRGFLGRQRARGQRRARAEARRKAEQEAKQKAEEERHRNSLARLAPQAIRIQKLWRGYRVRLRLSRIEKYDDSDLEELDDDFLFDERQLDFMAPPVSAPKPSAAGASSSSVPSYRPPAELLATTPRPQLPPQQPPQLPPQPPPQQQPPSIPTIQPSNVLVGRLRPSSAHSVSSHSDPNLNPSFTGSPDKAASIAQEWGISDSTTIELMMRRRAQLNKLRKNKDKVKAEQDPEKRLERFKRMAEAHPPVAAPPRATGSRPPRHSAIASQMLIASPSSAQIVGGGQPGEDWELMSVASSEASLPSISRSSNKRTQNSAQSRPTITKLPPLK